MKPHILPIIILAQFFCTSLWFAGNAVTEALVEDFGLAADALGHLTSVVQLGFIAGTLAYALLNLADRFAPSKVFMWSAALGAAANLAILLAPAGLWSLLTFRFLTGFFLAGIYPVGMKIASDYYQKGLGVSLGYLVGALVLGTAFPHLLRATGGALSWQFVFVTTSLLALTGGLLLLLFVPNGPHRSAGQKLDLSLSYKVFRKAEFRRAAFGYFGHMWELYAFWAFVPVLLQSYAGKHGLPGDLSAWAFAVIAVGSSSCVIGGYLARRLGTKRVALGALSLSGLCCLLAPLLFLQPSAIVFLAFMLLWGMVVIADSPLFSTLVAQAAPAASKGTALTIVNCLGFAITIFSIQLLNGLLGGDGLWPILLLAIGPVLGLFGAQAPNSPKTLDT